MNAENTGCQAPIEDLRAAALKHYDEISIYYGHWMAAIPVAINFYYDHLQANPHLLREDGEKEPDWQGEAEKIFNTHVGSVEPKALYSAAAITALTEFGKMWYDRGRGEEAERSLELFSKIKVPHDMQAMIDDYEKMKEQLAEKEKEYQTLHNSYYDIGLKADAFDKELTAAKEEIESLQCRLSNLNGANAILRSQLAEKENGYDAAFITWIGEQGLEYYPKRGGWLYWGSYMSLEKLYAAWKEKVNKSTHG